MDYLYVATGRAGLLKVGRTSQPAARRSQLVYEFKRRDDKLLSFDSFECHRPAGAAERWVVSEFRKREPATCGEEWFRSIGKAEAIGFVRRVCKSHELSFAERVISAYNLRFPTRRFDVADGSRLLGSPRRVA